MQNLFAKPHARRIKGMNASKAQNLNTLNDRHAKSVCLGVAPITSHAKFVC